MRRRIKRFGRQGEACSATERPGLLFMCLDAELLVSGSADEAVVNEPPARLVGGADQAAGCLCRAVS